MNRREGVRRLGLLAAVTAILVVLAVTASNGEPWALAAWFGYPVVGAVILAARPGNAIGRLMLAIGALWAVTGAGLVDWSGNPAPVWLELAGTLTAFVVWACLPALVVVFPSGRPETRFGRVLLLADVVVITLVVLAAVVAPHTLESGRENPLAWDGLAWPIAALATETGFVIIPLLIAVALIDLLLRHRRSTGAVRLQFRWFLFAVAVQVILLVSSVWLPAATDLPLVVVGLLFNLVPLAIGIAVTRYGLYEVDRVISRTTAYAVVTGAVLGTYAVVVTSLSRLLPVSSSFAVAAATLVAAAVFRPVLRRVRTVVDRHFDRERYDAARIVDAFGARLRTAVDPEVAAADLLAAVDRTLAPTAIGLWARETTR